MGVKISELLPKEAIKIDQLAGKSLAVDALNTIYQFLSIIRQYDGALLMDSKGKVTSHLSGLFYRNVNLMESGLRLAYVFDGKRPEFKRAVSDERKKRKLEARAKYEKALAKEDFEGARKYAQATAEITGGMIEESKELLSAMGIPVVQAPSEGEAQAAQMCRKHEVFGVASQDIDSLVFGSPVLIRNLNITGKRRIGGLYREVRPEIIRNEDILKNLGITHEQLIILSILVGTDYNQGGVFKIGPKKGIKLVKKHGTLEKVLENIEWTFDVDPKEILDFFKNPPVTDEYDLTPGRLDREKIKEILCNRHEFSEERVENALKKLEEKGKQRGLGDWMK